MAWVFYSLSCGCLNDSGGYKSLAAFVKFCVTDMLGRLSPIYFVWSYILLKLDIEKWSRYGKRDLLAGQGFLSVCFFKPNRNNYIEIETALDLTKYLAEEDEILVWFEVLVNLINRDVISDVNNYAIYPLLKVISRFVMWLLNQPSLPLSVLASICVTGLSKSNALFIPDVR